MEQQTKLKRGLYQKIQMERMKLERFRIKIGYLHPRNKLREKQQLQSELEQRLRLAMEKKLTLAKQMFAIRIERMKAASPLSKLNQGFSYVASEKGKVVKSIDQVKKDDKLTIYMTDGIVNAKVEDTVKEDYSGR